MKIIIKKGNISLEYEDNTTTGIAMYDTTADIIVKAIKELTEQVILLSKHE